MYKFKKSIIALSTFAFVTTALNPALFAKGNNMYQYSTLVQKVTNSIDGFTLKAIESKIEGDNIHFKIEYSSKTDRTIALSTMNHGKQGDTLFIRDCLKKDNSSFEFSIPALNLNNADSLKLFVPDTFNKSIIEKILNGTYTSLTNIDLSQEIIKKSAEAYKALSSTIIDKNKVEYQTQQENGFFDITEAGITQRSGNKELTVKYTSKQSGILLIGSGKYMYFMSNIVGNGTTNLAIPEEYIDSASIVVKELKDLSSAETSFYAANIDADNFQFDKNPFEVKNPYPSIDNTNIQYQNESIISPIMPYSDFFSLFTKLPLGHTVSTGKGTNIGVICNNTKLSDFINYIARDSKTYLFNELNVEDLKKYSINVVAIQDINLYDSKAIEDFVDKCLLNNIHVTLEGDLAKTDEQIKLVNSLEKMGAITVGQVARQGTTYSDSDSGSNVTKAFNDRLKDINIDIFVPNTIDANSVNYKYSLYGVTGAMALLNQNTKLNVSDAKKYLLEHSRNVWQSNSIDGTKSYYDDITTDNTTSQMFPKANSNIYFFKQLDFQKLFNIKLSLPWNANIYNLSKAWTLSKGNIDVAIIDQGFHPKNPFIKDNVVETKGFGNVEWNDNFHGTSMAKSLLSTAPAAKLHLFLADVFSTGGGLYSDNIIKAIDYCIEKKIPVISMSWSGDFADDKKLIDEIKKARNSGITVVWFHYPQAENDDGIIASAFTYYAFADKLAAFDRFIDEDMYYPQEIQAGLSCTAPQIAGLCALLKAKYPELTPAQIEALLKDNSIKLSNEALIPDMYKALKQK